MPIVKFTQPAEFDLQLIENYISYELQNPQAADDTILLMGLVKKPKNLLLFQKNINLFQTRFWQDWDFV